MISYFTRKEEIITVNIAALRHFQFDRNNSSNFQHSLKNQRHESNLNLPNQRSYSFICYIALLRATKLIPHLHNKKVICNPSSKLEERSSAKNETSAHVILVNVMYLFS